MTNSQAILELRDRPDIFSRGALELTFTLLREHAPGLALQVRNLLSGDTVCDPGLSEHQDYFSIILDGPSIQEVITAITEISQIEVDQPNPDPGKLVILKTLLQDWLALADFLLQEKILTPKPQSD